MRKMRTLCRLSALIVLWVGLLLVKASAAEQPTTIRGLIYISPSGELDKPWVILGRGVEIVLLRDDGRFDQKLKELREGWEIKIKAQEKVIRQTYDRSVAA